MFELLNNCEDADFFGTVFVPENGGLPRISVRKTYDGVTFRDVALRRPTARDLEYAETAEDVEQAKRDAYNVLRLESVKLDGAYVDGDTLLNEVLPYCTARKETKNGTPGKSISLMTSRFVFTLDARRRSLNVETLPDLSVSRDGFMNVVRGLGEKREKRDEEFAARLKERLEAKKSLVPGGECPVAG